jgi:hypothetical protein
LYVIPGYLSVVTFWKVNHVDFALSPSSSITGTGNVGGFTVRPTASPMMTAAAAHEPRKASTIFVAVHVVVAAAVEALDALAFAAASPGTRIVSSVCAVASLILHLVDCECTNFIPTRIMCAVQ